jgi:hypothetical protein
VNSIPMHFELLLTSVQWASLGPESEEEDGTADQRWHDTPFRQSPREFRAQ